MTALNIFVHIFCTQNTLVNTNLTFIILVKKLLYMHNLMKVYLLYGVISSFCLRYLSLSTHIPEKKKQSHEREEQCT